MLHRLAAHPAALHPRFAPDAPAILTVDPGDTVSLTDIPDVAWGLEPPTSLTLPRRKVEPRDAAGPCMLGPIAVRGARPGDALEISIDHVATAPWGWTYAGGTMATPAWNAAVGVGEAPLTLVRWAIDPAAGLATSDLSRPSPLRVPVRPFPGIIGLAPRPEPDGRAACAWTPRACGGNMDCRELIAGSTLWLPVMVDGAMLSVGDGHAAQGDGEVSGTAIETMLTELRLTLTLRHGMRLPCPRVRLPGVDHAAGRWMTLGFGPTLDDAAAMAMSGMLDLLESELGHTRAHCLALASTRVSLRITQLVNPAKGVHAVWEEAI